MSDEMDPDVRHLVAACQAIESISAPMRKASLDYLWSRYSGKKDRTWDADSPSMKAAKVGRRKGRSKATKS